MSILFFTASFNLIIPELNDFLSNLDGASLISWIIGLFTISAGISRPFSGKLADKIGRKKVMYIGIGIAIFICLLYPYSTTIWFLLTLRFLHGFSAGFFPTGATALITDILPETLRGKGMGIFGTFISLGIGLGQGFSSLTADYLGINGMFYTSSVLSIIALLFLLRVEETLEKPLPFKLEMLSIKSDEIIERNVAPVAIVMFLSASCSGIIFVLSPEISKYLHIHAKGWFFLWYVISTIGVRLFMGKISDRIGRRETLLIGMIILVISMVTIGLATNILWFTLSSVLFGVATGVSSPTIFAWTADLSPFHRRGIGAGTMFIALEFGILFGSIVTNVLYTSKFNSILNVYLFGGTMALLCVVYLIWHLLRRPSAT